MVDVAEPRAAGGADGLPVGIHEHVSHAGQIDDHTVAERRPRDVVSAGADRDRQPRLPGEPHRGDDVCRAPATDDERRFSLDHPVPDATSLCVARIAARDDLASNLPAQIVERGARSRRRACHDVLPLSRLRRPYKA